MSSFAICNVIGWVFLVASWTVGFFVTDKRKALVTSIILAVFATGIFTSNMIWMFCK